MLRDLFTKLHGYDVVEKISSLFEDVGDYAAVRYDFFRTLSRQFEQSFSVQIGDYCASKGLTWTGHYNGENGFRSVMNNVGNMMAQYRHMQRPGIDHLGLNLSRVVFMMKSLSSVANQYDRDRRLSEMFGIGGQNMSFEDRKWIADCHAVLGINHICPHLALYSMKGTRKRDYPPTFSPQQPYWPFNTYVEDYLARSCYLSSVGTYAAEFLVLVPLESAYIDYTNGTERSPKGDARFKSFSDLLETLLANQYCYDLGDEEILSDIGSVKNGALHVNAMQYRAVVLPFLRTIRSSTVTLLEKYAAEHGVILVIGGLPELVDGRTNPEMIQRLSAITRLLHENDSVSSLAALIPPALKVDGVNSTNIWVSRRLVPGGEMVMLFNRSRLESASIAVTLPDSEHPTLWDSATGKCLAVSEQNGTVQLRLAPAQSVFISTGRPSHVKTSKSTHLSLPGEVVATLSGKWQGKRLDPNAITLDFARYSIDNAAFSEPEPVIGIHERLTQQSYNGKLVLAFDVEVEKAPERAELVIEQPEMYTSITLNGHAVTFGKDFYRDIAFRRADVSAYLKSGKNTVRMELAYVAPKPASRDARERYGSEIESIYLIGDFGVQATVSTLPARSLRNERGDLPQRPVHRFSSFSIVGEQLEFDGDLALAGYPFYAGAFELKRTFNLKKEKGGRFVLTFPETETTVITAVVNGKKLPPLAWSPWEIDITDALKNGENTLILTFVNSLRNLLGPHHHSGGELTEVGPVSFTGRAGWPSFSDGDQNWFDVRKTSSTKIWTDDYHHIPFGLLTPPRVEKR